MYRPIVKSFLQTVYPVAVTKYRYQKFRKLRVTPSFFIRCVQNMECKATPNKFSVSRPGLKHNYMRAGGSFPLFHYKIGSFSSHYLPGTTIKSMLKFFKLQKLSKRKVCAN